MKLTRSQLRQLIESSVIKRGDDYVAPVEAPLEDPRDFDFDLSDENKEKLFTLAGSDPESGGPAQADSLADTLDFPSSGRFGADTLSKQMKMYDMSLDVINDPEIDQLLDRAIEDYLNNYGHYVADDLFHVLQAGYKYPEGPGGFQLFLNGDPDLKELESYVGNTSLNLLNEWGYDMEKYKMFFTEFWVQEFSKNGGGHHSTHVHWDNHISGFYFLKCSDKTSYPVMHDPRAGAMMTKLPQKDGNKITPMIDQLHYRPKPGMLVFFPAYVPHEFAVDMGVDDFRFIHFNLQAVRNNIVGNK